MPTAGARLACVHGLAGFTTDSSSLLLSNWLRCACWTSTTGDAPDTVTDSCSAPTLSAPSMVAVKPDGKLTPSRITFEKPSKVNVTVYTPGRKSTIEYRPCPSVTTVRLPSMSAGLVASTATPGSTAPVSSLTAPAMTLCADAAAGGSTTMPTRSSALS